MVGVLRLGAAARRGSFTRLAEDVALLAACRGNETTYEMG